MDYNQNGNNLKFKWSMNLKHSYLDSREFDTTSDMLFTMSFRSLADSIFSVLLVNCSLKVSFKRKKTNNARIRRVLENFIL